MIINQLAITGITLVEILVVIAIFGIGAALLIPAIATSREAARRGDCQNRLHQLALAVNEYQASHRRFPHGHLFGPTGTGWESRSWSWIAEVLPNLAQSELYRVAMIPRRAIRESNIAQHDLPFLRCPSDTFSRGKPFHDCGNLEGLPSAGVDEQFDNLGRMTQVTQQDVSGGNTVADKRVDFAYFSDGQFDTVKR